MYRKIILSMKYDWKIFNNPKGYASYKLIRTDTDNMIMSEKI